MTDALIRRRKDTERHRGECHVKKEAKINDVFTCQRRSKIAGNHQKLGEKYGPDSPSEPLEGTNTDNTLISDLWTPEL